MQIAVNCSKCFRPCPMAPSPRPGELSVYLLDEPCPNCGATAWAAHDITRDPKTGRSLIARELDTKSGGGTID